MPDHDRKDCRAFRTICCRSNLAKSGRRFRRLGIASVHLCEYPTPAGSKTNAQLSRQMSLLREIASSGRSARMAAKLKVRQPLSGVTVILNDPTEQAWLEAHEAILMEELNVQSVTYTADAGEYVTYQIAPNFKRLGPRVGKLMPKVKQAFADADGSKILEELSTDGKTVIEVEDEQIELDNEDVEVRLQANEGWAAAQGPNAVVVLSTELTPELIRLGKSRDVVRLVQDRRKEMDLQFTDRIDLWLVTDSDELRTAIDENREYIMKETLSVSLNLESPADDIEAIEREVGEDKLSIFIRVAN